MKTIVVPTDFSDEAAKALPVAAQLARLFNAQLHLVHVLPRVVPNYSFQIHDVDALYRQALGQAEHRFEELKTIPCLSGLHLHTHVVSGVEPVDLLQDVRFAGADLLVIASTGATGLQEILLGSNAEHLIRRANMPVLVLKNPPAYIDLKTVVFASDFQNHYDSSIDFLRSLFDGFGYPTIHLLFVNTLSHFVPTHDSKPAMEAFAARYGLSGCTFNLVDEFDVEKGLLDFAKETKADLIVLGTHGRRGLRHLLEGSIAEDVANHATIPVLTLPLRSEHTPIVILEGMVI